MAAPLRLDLVLACKRVILFSRFNVKSLRQLSTSTVSRKPEKNVPFDKALLEVLVCPISKQSLRYDAESNELISDAINVAYPIRNGIPNLVLTDGRILKDNTEKGSPSDDGTPV
ncbi:UPF0434 protein RD1_0037-like isoform X2 [Lytechinus variegatus]|uniref:UPF0434 protein RD1_0037-like isoform X2 n=1 Tax=Lytechinus variegatus TaxID=7654 RepID=UPI001BB13C40|nr:UPF0434 protein RD1_0037-like isoform X2 [Lytechinus variegatus]